MDITLEKPPRPPSERWHRDIVASYETPDIELGEPPPVPTKEWKNYVMAMDAMEKNPTIPVAINVRSTPKSSRLGITRKASAGEQVWGNSSKENRGRNTLTVQEHLAYSAQKRAERLEDGEHLAHQTGELMHEQDQKRHTQKVQGDNHLREIINEACQSTRQKPEKLWLCTHCGEKQVNAYILRKHLKLKHETGKWSKETSIGKVKKFFNKITASGGTQEMEKNSTQTEEKKNQKLENRKAEPDTEANSSAKEITGGGQDPDDPGQSKKKIPEDSREEKEEEEEDDDNDDDNEDEKKQERSRKGIRMDEKKPFCLRPTWEEFHDFNQFMDTNKDLLKTYGALKVTPPKEWEGPKEYQKVWDISIHRTKEYSFKGESGFFKVKPHYINIKTSVKKYKESVIEEYPRPPADAKSKFWDALPYRTAEYAVDIEETLFPKELKEWNLRQLPDFFNTTMRQKERHIPGMTSSYMYFGSYGAPFALHKEDWDTGSISYLHLGDPKIWYVIPQRFARQMDKVYRKKLPGYLCSSIERHKLLLIDPRRIPRGVLFHEVIQEEGDFVVTAPGAYHEGFNMGFNVTEATTWCPPWWLKLANAASVCDCRKHIDLELNDFKETADDLNKSPMPHVIEIANEPTSSSLPPVNATADDSSVSFISPSNDAQISKPMDEQRKDEEGPRGASPTPDGTDVYEFVEEREDQEDATSPTRKGRKRDHRKEDNANHRPSKMCPLCRKAQERNFDRHLRLGHKILSSKRRTEILTEATARTLSGLRYASFDTMPKILKENWNDTKVRKEMESFLDHIGAVVVEDQEDQDKVEAVEPARKRSKQTEEEEESEEDEEMLLQQPPAQSAKAKMVALSFPRMGHDTTVIKELISLKKKDESNKKRQDLIKTILTPVTRILGYVQMAHSEDQHGWECMLDTERIREYIQIIRSQGGVQPSTAKTYLDYLLTLYKITLDHFFDKAGWPEDPMEHHLLTLKMKGAQTSLKDIQATLTAKRDLDLAEKNQEFGANLPDVNKWELYLSDSDVREKFEKSLETLEKASQVVFAELASNPGKSPLRSCFNFTAEFLATQQLFLAARPGELSKCTLQEYDQAVTYGDSTLINVRGHKTGRQKLAVISIDNEKMPLYRRYRAVLRRFSSQPELAFPFLGSDGFKENKSIYRMFNKWLESNNLPRFTCTKMRKIVETTVDLSGTSKDKANIRSGLNHSQRAVEKSYKCPTKEKAIVEKKAIQRVKEEAKFRKKIEERPFPFSIDVFNGFETPQDISQFVKSQWDITISLTDDLVEAYKFHWRECAKPLIIKAFMASIQQGEASIDDVETVTRTMPEYQPMAEDILLEIKTGFNT